MTTIMMTVLMLFIQTTLGAPETDGPFNLFNAESGIKQEPARWVSGGRLYYINTGKCAGVSGQTDGSTLVYSDCDEKSHLQQWECSNNTLLTLKGQTLYLHVNDNNGLALSRDTGPRSRWIISGTTDGPCSRTHRELFTIEGNAFGRPCQFPFRYKDQWYGDCTSIDSSNEWLWCAIETNYQDKELWGYCPSKSMEHWHKNPVTGAFYQVNLGSALTWHQARTSCQQQGADLASITEPLEQTYLTGLSGTEHVPLWTGLNALEEDSGWQWISGKPFRYLRWDSGHPLSDPGQICGLVNLARQSYWQSSLCSKSHGYICQKDPPTPAAHPEEIGFCSSPWIPYAARCYLLQRTKKTWTEAQTECRKDGGDLASIHNVEQHSFVMSQLGYAAADELWIGMNDVKTPLLFEWSDQSAVTFIRWEEAMPMGGNCVLVRGEGRYATQVCENQHGFICMKKSSSKPSGDQVDTYPGCKPHWTRHGSYCYFVGPEIKTFDEAKETCKSSQSYLADVSSRVDNAFLISLVGSRPEQHFWIGLSNRNHIDIFSWTNSNRVRYTHWNAQMPGSRQGCVAMTTGTLAGLWDVLSCTNQEKYICKHLAEGAGPTPEPITPVPPRCHEGWYPVGSRNYCFKFFTGSRADKKTWFEAQDFCRVIGGDLLSIHSSMDLQSMHHVSHGTSWIGLSAQDPNTGYAWTDGSPLSFQHWIEGEPNNYNSVESCAEITISLWDEAGSWNDVDCESYNDWLCEIPKGMTPLPPPNNTIPEYNVTEDGWLEYGGSQYYFNTELLTMENARHYCQQRHGDLVVITGLTENIFLWKKINKENLGSHYIGLTVDLDRSFGWMDGSPVVFQRWDNNQPDFRNNDENCVVMYSSMGFWHDNNCGEEIRSICKRSGSPPVNSTVPPTVPPTGGCPPKWVLYQSKCYNLIENLPPSTWLNARSICQTLGGNLASIVNRREQVFLTTQMTSGATDLWIGLSNLNRDTFVWTDGQAVKYLNLGLMKRVPQIFPSRWYHNSRMFMDMFSGASQCIVMTSSFSNLGKWETRSCNDTHGFICQRKVDSGIPVPAPTVLPSGWVKLANDSYKVLTQNWTWPEARMKCEAEEGQLASTLDALSTAYLELQALNLQTPLWIGLNRNETEGYFRWIDGWKLSMAQWAQDEPSRDRPCVYLDVKGTWKTALCNHTYPSVCKKSLAVPPTASPQHPGKCIQEEEISGRNSPWSWLPFRGHCYSFVNNDIEWADASISCISNGASLVSIEDPAELDFIKSNLEFLKDSYSSFWIGLYRTHLGQWKWLDQTVSDFINWAEGQPQGSFHYSYGYMLSSDGTWGTAPRWADKPYICKKPKVLPETPPTHVSLKTDQRRVYSGLAVVVVLAAMCLMGLTALMLYKKTGRPLPSFTKPLVFSAGRRAFDNPLYTDPVTEVDPSMVDTSQLVNPVEAQPMITL